MVPERRSRSTRASGLFVLALAATACLRVVPDPAPDDLAPTATAVTSPDTTWCHHLDPKPGEGEQAIELQVHGNDPDTIQPAVVWLHGGGWYSGSPTDLDVPGVLGITAGRATAELLNHGWVVISAGYRLTGEASFPSPLTDVKAAINCAGEIAGVDAERVAVAGDSAGGHLATVALLTPGLHEPQPIAGPVPAGEFDGSADPGGTLIDAAVNVDGPTDLAALTLGFGSPPDETNLDQPLTNPVPPAAALIFGPEGATFRKLVPAFVCGTADPTECPIEDVEAASPLHLLTAQPDQAGRQLYLVCADTPTMPVGFHACTDAEAFAALVDPTDEAFVLHLDGSSEAPRGNHLTANEALNFTELLSFLNLHA